jgi:hypothetical protein
MAMGWTSPRAQECSLVSSEWAPRGSAKTTRPEIVVTFTSTCGAIDVSSVHMTIDDETVAHTVKGSGQKITVSHTPPSALTDDADHTVTVNVRDDEGTTGEKVWTFNIPDSYSR